MKKFILFSLVLIGLSQAHAQISWDGGGDGTSWEDAMNWENDMVPALDSLVEFGIDATITGTMTNIPVQLRVLANTAVVFDLDLTVGNGVTEEHALTFGDTSSFTLAANRTLTLNPASNKHGMAIFGSTDGATVQLSANTTVSVLQAQVGINSSNATSSFQNDGTILLAAGVNNALRSKGTFTNNGTITIAEVSGDAVQIDGGTFTNTATGSITANKPNDDGLEVIGGGSFVNNGSLAFTAKDDASSGNAPIAIGNAEEMGLFTNNGSVMADGGLDTVARAIYVYPMGDFSNAGTVNLTGGFQNSRLLVQGNATNELNGIIDLTDGRANINTDALFVNNGLVKSTRDGSGVFTSGTVINNAFYDYSNSNQFASGSTGTITDNGISLNNNDTRINAMNECTVDIAEAAYEWFYDGVSLGTADATGSFTFPMDVLMADSVDLTTSLPDVSIRVFNICDDAVMGSNGVFSPVMATPFSVYPNPVNTGQQLFVDLTAFESALGSFELINAQGQVVARYQLQQGTRQAIELPTALPNGMYSLSSRTGDQLLLSRIVKL